MITTTSGAARRNLICLVYLGLACRVFIPVGYMPAPLSEGGPIVLCPSALPSGMFRISGDRHADHRHSGEDGSSTEPNAWEFCTFGAAPGIFALVTDFEIRLLSFAHAAPQSEPESIVELLLSRPYKARAPPVAQSIEA